MSQLIQVPGASQDAFNALSDQIAMFQTGQYINSTSTYSSFGAIQTSGQYRIGITFLASATDKPVDAGGILVVTTADVMYQQTYYTTTGTIYTRFKAGSGSWTAWKQVTLT